MKMKTWEIMSKDKDKNVIDILLKNRGFKTEKEKEEFFNPTHPEDLSLKDLGISVSEVKKAIKRIRLAKDKKEKVIIYGDYDADGITATAIMWEALNKIGLDVMPYIPDRFEEGYGINGKTLTKLKADDPELKLVVTVDNGIVANDAIKTANKLGIDVIVTDHHKKGKKLTSFATIHTTQIAGSAVSWILARELGIKSGLELAAIGTIADQMPLIFANRSFAKHGIKALQKTKRAGLMALMEEAGVKTVPGVYEINYIIAPRINSMGRLKHGIESLRLLCTKDKVRARELSKLIGKTNSERQTIVEKTVVDVRKKAVFLKESIIFLSDKSYHEGIIGLAAGRLTEEFYKPAIVVSIGEKFSKGSARSISGFNITDAIRAHSEMLVAHGGHTLAAGFTIETTKLEAFRKKISKTANELITDEMLTKKLKVDMELNFDVINFELEKKLKEFNPTGMGNPSPTFLTYGTEVMDAKLLGKEKNHLKLKLKKDMKFIDAIGFGMGKEFGNLKKGEKIDVAYTIDENIWNGTRSLQLRIRDLRISI